MAKCLIVEDSDVVRFVAMRIFEALGHEGLEAESPAAALKLCEEQDVDCVLLDWDMPQLGALDFLQGTARSCAGKFPIILCATENDPQQFALARAAGAKYHLLKPFDADTVKSILEMAGIGDPETANKAPVAASAAHTSSV